MTPSHRNAMCLTSWVTGGGSVNEGPTRSGWGDADPVSPPPTAGGDNYPRPMPTSAAVSLGPTGAPPAQREPPPLCLRPGRRRRS